VPDSRSALVRSCQAGRRGLLTWFGAAVDVCIPTRARQSVGGSSARQAAFAPATLPPTCFESLEGRQLLSTVYLSSSSGRDGNSGTSSSAPVASIAKAAVLTKPGDTLLLKRGDTWGQGLGSWGKSGVTISAYGSGANPKIASSAKGLEISRASNFTVRGITFVGLNKTSNFGIVTTGGNGNLTIADCDVSGYRMNIVLQGYFGPINGAKVLNTRVAYTNGIGMSSGLFAEGVNNLTLSNSLFDHNGGSGSMYNHGAYIMASCNNFVATGNTFSNNAAAGMQARAGGLISGNTFKSNGIGLTVGIVNGAGYQKDGGVTCTVTNNTFTGPGYGLNTGYGLDLGNIKSGTVTNNRFVNGPGKKYGYAISLDYGTATGRQVGVNNLTISGNTISNWGSTKINISANAQARNVTIFGNSLS
jgi:hypothetical protein